MRIQWVVISVGFLGVLLVCNVRLLLCNATLGCLIPVHHFHSLCDSEEMEGTSRISTFMLKSSQLYSGTVTRQILMME